jgi:hypothetical protein
MSSFALLLAGCGGDEGRSAQATTEADCTVLGSTSKPIVDIAPETAVRLRKIRAFRQQRRPRDHVPRELRNALNQLAGGGGMTPAYDKSRRIDVVRPGIRTGAYLIPAGTGRLCFGFSSLSLPLDCVRGFVGGVATWVVTASSCRPSTNAFVAVATDDVRALRLDTVRGQVRLPVIGNVAAWRAASHIRTTDDLRRVMVIKRDGSVSDVTG